MENKVADLLRRLQEVNRKLLDEHQKSRTQIQKLIHEQKNFLAERQEHQRFLSEVVHSVSNSLTILRLSIEIFRQKIPGTDFRIIEEEIKLIERTLRQLIKSAEVEALSLFTAKKIDLGSLFARLVREKKTAAHCWEEQIARRVFVVGFARDLATALENLLENAEKYTPAGKKITCTLTTKGENAVIKIADEGCGIAAEETAKIFRAFWRSPAQKNQKRGSGLGLSLVNKIVKKHNGLIEAQSHLGVGTTFIVVLPLAEA